MGTNLFSGLSVGLWPFLVAWVFPSSIVSTLFSIWILPSLKGSAVVDDIYSLNKAQQTLLLVFASVAIGLILSAISTTLYRTLEGYYFPKRLRKWKSTRELQRKQALLRQVEEAYTQSIHKAEQPGERANIIDLGLLREKLHGFPADNAQIAPTRFANGIRALETYGYDRFCLDSQVLWSELIAVAPRSLQNEQEQARGFVNFFVSFIYLSLALGLAAFFSAWQTPSDRTKFILIGLTALLVSPLCYWFAVMSTKYWHSAVQALVNIGRKELAVRLGLQLPRRLEDEREMWQEVSSFVYEYFDPTYEGTLDKYRQIPESEIEQEELVLSKDKLESR